MALSVHKNLQEERDKLRFDINELSELIFGCPEDLKTFLKYQEYMDKEPVQQYNPDYFNLSRLEKMQEYSKKFQNYHAKFNYNNEETFLLGFIFYNDPLTTSIHQAMFLPCLKILTTQKQFDKWYVPLYFIF